MSNETLSLAPRAYPARNDLRAELNAIAQRSAVRYSAPDGHILNDGKPVMWAGEYFHIPVTKAAALAGDFDRMAMPQLGWRDDGSWDDGFACAIPRAFFFELVEHERRFGRVSRIGEADRLESGVDMMGDNSWPFCAECLLPFVAMLNGSPRTGVWVERIADGEDLCGCCWLAENYRGDADAMIRHVLASCERGAREMAGFLLRHVSRKWSVGFGFQDVTPSFWAAPGLWELLRLHRVSLVAAAAGILRYSCDVICAVKADEFSIDRFASRDERVCA